MKRAPVIPKHTIKTQPLEDTPSSAPAAPMVDSLIARRSYGSWQCYYFACMW